MVMIPSTVEIQVSRFNSLPYLHDRSVAVLHIAPSLPDPWSCSHLYPLPIVDIFFLRSAFSFEYLVVHL